jgi:hypothetical protein
MMLMPRHERLISYLNERSPAKFGLDELANVLNLSSAVLRNEAPQLVKMGYLKRKATGRTFEYYVEKTPSRYMPIAQQARAATQAEFGSLLYAIVKPGYKPVLTKLDWSMPFTVAHLARAAATGDLTQQATARQALESFLEAMEATELACRKLLATPQLWDANLSNWLTAGLTEENLEKLEELTRQAIEKHGKLQPQEREEPT